LKKRREILEVIELQNSGWLKIKSEKKMLLLLFSAGITAQPSDKKDRLN